MPVMHVMTICSNGNSGCSAMASTSISFTLLVAMAIVAVKIRLAVLAIISVVHIMAEITAFAVVIIRV